MKKVAKKKARKPKKGWVYVLKHEELFKVGFTTSRDIRKRLYYWRSRLNVNFKPYIVTSQVSDGYTVENRLMWYLRSRHCYVDKLNGKFTCELFFDVDQYIKDFMEKEKLTYRIEED